MRLVLSSMGLIAATYGLARFGYGLFLPQFQEAFDLDGATAGLIQSGSFLSYCVAAVLAAPGARWPRGLVIAAGASASLGSLAVAAAPSGTVLGIGVVVAGAGAGFATPGTVGLIARLIDERGRERAQTTVNAGTGVGLVIAGFLLAATAQNWRIAWVVIGVAAVLTMVATLISARHRMPASGVGSTTDSSLRPFHLFDVPGLGRIMTMAALSGAGSAAVWTFGRTHLDAAGPGVFPGQSFSVIAWILLGAMSVIGALAAQLVQRWSLSRAWSVTNLALLLGTAGVGLAPAHPVIAYSAVSLFGAGYTAMTGVLIVWAMRLAPRASPVITVALFVALALGQAAGAMILGALHDVSSAPVLFLAALIMGALAIAVQPRSSLPKDNAAVLTAAFEPR